MDTIRDVLIIGAGISGIALAVELGKRPHIDFEILEKRSNVGGTWDIFRYPGVRSDSDMDSYSFSFEPWRGSRPLASGEQIQRYLENVADKHGLSARTTFNTHVESVEWDSSEQLWRVTSSAGVRRARYVHIAGGYFCHEQGYLPNFEGAFSGPLVHPQNWPADLNWEGKRIVVVGSGATAASVTPELAKKAQVTMVQRSPSHMAPMPNHALKLPFRLRRGWAIAQNQLIIALARKAPKMLNRALDAQRSRILPEQMRHHFRPDYPVWDQRVCRIPDGDLFHAIADGAVEVVTGDVDRLSAQGVVVGGTEIGADIIVAATGLKLQALGGITISVDGARVELGETAAYRGCMLHDVPNLSFTMGYVNESFTLRAELVAEFVAKLVDSGRVVTPQGQPGTTRVPIIDLQSGYVKRGIKDFPFVTDAEPYALHNSHYREAAAFKDPRDLDFGYRWPNGIRARVEGPEDGDCVVLLHGIGRSLEDFDEVHLPGKRLIALDIPGFGATPGLNRPSMSDIADALWKAVAECAPGRRVTLVGNSLGGALAMRMSLQHPERVRRVALLAPSGFSEEITASVKIAASPVGQLFLKAAGGVLAAKVEAAVSNVVTPKALDVARRNAQNPDHVRTFVSLSRELVGIEEGSRMGVAKRFADLNIPTHILWGSADTVLPAVHADQARQVIPHATIDILDGVGHIVQRERPAEVCQAVSLT